jgi:hypothetical protein
MHMRVRNWLLVKPAVTGYVPATQSEQTVTAAVENLPAVQLMQAEAEAPVDATNMPPEQ